MSEADACPFSNRDDRKSAALAEAEARPDAGFAPIVNFDFARDVMRSPAMVQGMEADYFKDKEPSKVPVIFLDGELHKKRRAQLARYFTPKAIKDRHRKVMDQTTDEVMAQLRRTGRGQLDVMSLRLACDVAAEIVGLTNTDPDAMSNRLRKKFTASGKRKRPGLAGKLGALEDVVRTLWFFKRDVVPAIRHRQKHDRDDVISFLVREGYSDQEILVECMTYATAGMITTREFIVMCAWHLLEKEDLRRQFLEGGEDVQFAILDEVLRIDPVAAYVYRKAEADMTATDGRVVKAGEQFLVDIRNINLDEEATGACPFAIDPERSKRQKMPSNWMSFADGPHRCPGAQVAMHETRVFLDALLRVPGIRLARKPTMGWIEEINGYELHGAIVECDPSR
ncbi:cytochrome P450 [Novosphingobium sp. G106]|uniref:cytochrome P450 n=1 Tax=Novosphingobium sp. G106 TaxID=2849500 RepID=UPI001C2D434C|nr:cytochrome P450 [Novosphingobium sp. G106]MBV1690576.1 cytochrome P450 [Novosphingobium sp. G106]